MWPEPPKYFKKFNFFFYFTAFSSLVSLRVRAWIIIAKTMNLLDYPAVLFDHRLLYQFITRKIPFTVASWWENSASTLGLATVPASISPSWVSNYETVHLINWSHYITGSSVHVSFPLYFYLFESFAFDIPLFYVDNVLEHSRNSTNAYWIKESWRQNPHIYRPLNQ